MSKVLNAKQIYRVLSTDRKSNIANELGEPTPSDMIIKITPQKSRFLHMYIYNIVSLFFLNLFFNPEHVCIILGI